jgi:hypothetical protein
MLFAYNFTFYWIIDCRIPSYGNVGVRSGSNSLFVDIIDALANFHIKGRHIGDIVVVFPDTDASMANVMGSLKLIKGMTVQHPCRSLVHFVLFQRQIFTWLVKHGI